MIVWPDSLLVPASVKLALVSASRSGGATIAGNEQVVASPGSQRWAISFGGIVIRTRQHIRAWRAIEALVDGRANPLLVPIYDRARGPVPSQLGAGLLFDGASFLPGASSIQLAADAALNATTLAVSWASSPAPKPGQHFAIGTDLHRVAAVAPTGPRAATLTVRPWLRSAAAAGTPLNFDDPHCAVRLAKDDGMSDLDLQLWRFAAPSIDFVEAA